MPDAGARRSSYSGRDARATCGNHFAIEWFDASEFFLPTITYP